MREMNKKVLITCDMHESFFEGLKALGYSFNYNPEFTTEETFGILADYEGLVVSTKVLVDKSLINKGIKLEFIARAGSGMENIDVEYAQSKDIDCFSSPEGNSNAVGEFALGMLLSLLRNIVKADKEVRDELWLREENRGSELSGKTIGIIGYGNTGRAFAKILNGFDVRILVYDKYLKGYGTGRIAETDMEDIFINADIVSFHVPLTAETKYFINKKLLQSFNKRIILINTSRGKIIDNLSLIEALKMNKLEGVCLDVLDEEPVYDGYAKKHVYFNELRNFNNVILSPHIAGWTIESREKMSRILLEKLRSTLYKS